MERSKKNPNKRLLEDSSSETDDWGTITPEEEYVVVGRIEKGGSGGRPPTAAGFCCIPRQLVELVHNKLLGTDRVDPAEEATEEEEEGEGTAGFMGYIREKCNIM